MELDFAKQAWLEAAVKVKQMLKVKLLAIERGHSS